MNKEGINQQFSICEEREVMNTDIEFAIYILARHDIR